MKKFILKYFIAVFLIAIYFLKGIAVTMPALFTDAGSKSFFTALMDTETDNNKSNTEEKIDPEIKEFYLHYNFLMNFNLSAVTIIPKNILENKTAYKQHVYASIPTPPPELI